MNGKCIKCGKPARMMAAAPTRHNPGARRCCGVTYYPHVPRTIPVEPSYRERVAAAAREQGEVGMPAPDRRLRHDGHGDGSVRTVR